MRPAGVVAATGATGSAALAITGIAKRHNMAMENICFLNLNMFY
jgi:hypothetical protein